MNADLDMPDVADARGHLINAADKDTIGATRDMNCFWMPILGGCVIVAVATKDIPANEELLTAYGERYGWGLQ